MAKDGSRIPNPLGFWPATTRARDAKRRLDRAEQKLLNAQAEHAAAWTEWNDHHATTSARFHRPIPPDPALLDVLAQIEIGPCGEWWWHGLLNNKGLPTFRLRDSGKNTAPERSTVKYLAEQLNGHDGRGALFPTGSTMDVNPAHRKVRGTHIVKGPWSKHPKPAG